MFEVEGSKRSKRHDHTLRLKGPFFIKKRVLIVLSLATIGILLDQVSKILLKTTVQLSLEIPSVIVT